MKTLISKITIAKDFSSEPIGRYRTDSNTSGEAFLEDYLYPALIKFDSVVIDLDAAEGYGSSFLEEAFGGLIRKSRMSLFEFEKKVTIISNDDPTLIAEIKEYVADEVARSTNQPSKK